MVSPSSAGGRLGGVVRLIGRSEGGSFRVGAPSALSPFSASNPEGCRPPPPALAFGSRGEETRPTRRTAGGENAGNGPTVGGVLRDPEPHIATALPDVEHHHDRNHHFGELGDSDEEVREPGAEICEVVDEVDETDRSDNDKPR